MSLERSSRSVDEDINSRMVVSSKEVIKGDEPTGLINLYRKHFAPDSTGDLSGVDAIYMHNNKLMFVEFKNSPSKNVNKIQVQQKILHSLLVCQDIFNLNISYMRENAIYVVVYRTESIPQDNSHRDDISIRKNIKKTVRFNLSSLKSTYLLDVRTIGVQEFTDLFT